MKLVYAGPEGQVNYDVGAQCACGCQDPELKADHEYDLPKELAVRLLDSSAWFAKATAKKADD